MAAWFCVAVCGCQELMTAVVIGYWERSCSPIPAADARPVCFAIAFLFQPLSQELSSSTSRATGSESVSFIYAIF